MEWLGYAAVAAVVSGIFTLAGKLIDRHWAKKDKMEEKFAEIMRRHDDIDKKLDAHIAKDDERYIIQRRETILAFADELVNEPERLHTQGRFEQILRSITEYENYCDAHPNFENAITVQANEIIRSTHKKCCEKHSFI